MADKRNVKEDAGEEPQEAEMNGPAQVEWQPPTIARYVTAQVELDNGTVLNGTIGVDKDDLPFVHIGHIMGFLIVDMPVRPRSGITKATRHHVNVRNIVNVSFTADQLQEDSAE